MNIISQLFQHRNLCLIPAGLRLIGNVCYYSSKAQGTCWNLSTVASVIEQVAAAQNQFILVATEIHHKWIFQLLKKKMSPENISFVTASTFFFYLYSLCVSVLEWCTGFATFPTHFAVCSAEYPQWTLDGSIRRQINVVRVTTRRQCNAKWFQPYQPLLEESSQTPLSVKWSQNATSKQTSLVSQSAGQVKLFFCCLAVHKNKNKNSFFFLWLPLGVRMTVRKGNFYLYFNLRCPVWVMLYQCEFIAGEGQRQSRDMITLNHHLEQKQYVGIWIV